MNRWCNLNIARLMEIAEEQPGKETKGQLKHLLKNACSLSIRVEGIHIYHAAISLSGILIIGH